MLKKVWLPRWGAPQVLLADATQAFVSNQWLQFCQQHGIRLVQVPPFLQQANGLNEHLTQTALNLLRRFILDKGGEWSDGLPLVVSIYRNLSHAVVKMSLNCALLGQDIRLFGTAISEFAAFVSTAQSV